jgi:hypothetical protein
MPRSTTRMRKRRGHQWAAAYDTISIQRHSNTVPELAGSERPLAVVFLHMGNHFENALTEILDWYPLAEALGLQQTIPTLRDGALQITLTFDLSGAVLVCDCPSVVDLNLCS